MKLHRDLEELKGIRNPVVTTGSFDGVHIGHKAIIRRLRKLAKEYEGESVLITFDPHPRRVLYPETEGKDLLMILSQQEKIELMEKTGLDHLMIINFTREFSEISSHDFIRDILVDILHARAVVVGFNHQFGHRREGDFGYLYKLGNTHGFIVEEIPEQDIQNESVSSTKIRNALMQGNIQRANAYLDHYYIVKGKPVRSVSRTDILGRDIYSLILDEYVKLIPPDGVYAISIACGSWRGKGVLLISKWAIKGSMLSRDIRIEFHPLEKTCTFSDKEVSVYFHKRLREAPVSTDPESSRQQFERDIDAVEDLIY